MACGKPLTFKTPLPSSSVCNEFEYHTLASKLTSLAVNNTTQTVTPRSYDQAEREFLTIIMNEIN